MLIASLSLALAAAGALVAIVFGMQEFRDYQRRKLRNLQGGFD